MEKLKETFAKHAFKDSLLYTNLIAIRINKGLFPHFLKSAFCASLKLFNCITLYPISFKFGTLPPKGLLSKTLVQIFQFPLRF